MCHVLSKLLCLTFRLGKRKQVLEMVSWSPPPRRGFPTLGPCIWVSRPSLRPCLFWQFWGSSSRPHTCMQGRCSTIELTSLDPGWVLLSLLLQLRNLRLLNLAMSQVVGGVGLTQVWETFYPDFPKPFYITAVLKETK